MKFKHEQANLRLHALILNQITNTSWNRKWFDRILHKTLCVISKEKLTLSNEFDRKVHGLIKNECTSHRCLTASKKALRTTKIFFLPTAVCIFQFEKGFWVIKVMKIIFVNYLLTLIFNIYSQINTWMCMNSKEILNFNWSLWKKILTLYSRNSLIR